MKKNNLENFKKWRSKAEEDYSSAVILAREGGVPATICFLAQQVAEKYLKGFLAFNEIDFPKIHQLDVLLGMCAKVDKEFLTLVDEAVELSDYYIESRYPLETDFTIQEDEAREALAKAEKVKDFVNERVDDRRK